MTIGEVMDQIDEGITRDFIYYLERAGYIHPQKTPSPSGKIQRRRYTENDVLKIKLMWKYYDEGRFTPRVAYEKASAESKSNQLGLWD